MARAPHYSSSCQSWFCINSEAPTEEVRISEGNAQASHHCRFFHDCFDQLACILVLAYIHNCSVLSAQTFMALCTAIDTLFIWHLYALLRVHTIQQVCGPFACIQGVTISKLDLSSFEAILWLLFVSWLSCRIIKEFQHGKRQSRSVPRPHHPQQQRYHQHCRASLCNPPASVAETPISACTSTFTQAFEL